MPNVCLKKHKMQHYKSCEWQIFLPQKVRILCAARYSGWSDDARFLGSTRDLKSLQRFPYLPPPPRQCVSFACVSPLHQGLHACSTSMFPVRLLVWVTLSRCKVKLFFIEALQILNIISMGDTATMLTVLGVFVFLVLVKLFSCVLWCTYDNKTYSKASKGARRFRLLCKHGHPHALGLPLVHSTPLVHSDAAYCAQIWRSPFHTFLWTWIHTTVRLQ